MPINFLSIGWMMNYQIDSSRPVCYDTVSTCKQHKVTAKPIESHLPPSTVWRSCWMCERPFYLNPGFAEQARPAFSTITLLLVRTVNHFLTWDWAEEPRIKSLVQGRIWNWYTEQWLYEWKMILTTWSESWEILYTILYFNQLLFSILSW